MHRVLGHYDCLLLAGEVHLPCGGVSVGIPGVFTLTNPGGFLGTWKRADTVQMGSSAANPLGMGHDAGPLRPHILGCPDPSMSVGQSLLATILSSDKTYFASHKTQVNAGGSMLPICLELVPLGMGSVLVCGTPPVPNTIPLIPSQTNVMTSMSWGDYFGALANIALDIALSLLFHRVGNSLGGKGTETFSREAFQRTFPRTAARLARSTASRAVGRAGSEAAEAAVSRSLGSRVRRGIAGVLTSAILGQHFDLFGDGFNAGAVAVGTAVVNRIASGRNVVSFGPSNLGTPLQQAIDGDGVTHDGDASLGFGVLGKAELDQHGDVSWGFPWS